MRRHRERPPRFAAIRQLRCYEEVRERLVAGYPLADVARYVQDEEGEYGHASRRSLAEALRRFVEKEIAPAGIVASQLPGYVAKATAEFGNRLEDLRRLERAYEVALYRLDLAHGQERRTGVIDPKVTKQIEGLVRLIGQMHEIKLNLGLVGERDVGILAPSPERLQEIRERYGEGAARAFANPVQRAQVLGLLRRVLRLSGRSDVIDRATTIRDVTASAPAPPEDTEGVAPCSEPPPRPLRPDDDEEGSRWRP